MISFEIKPKGQSLDKMVYWPCWTKPGEDPQKPRVTWSIVQIPDLWGIFQGNGDSQQ